MAEKDWNRWGAYLNDLSQPIDAARDAHDGFVLSGGVAAGSGTSFFAWIAQLTQLQDPSWIFIAAGIAMLALTIGAAGVAFVLRRVEKSLDKKVQKDATFLRADMHKTHPLTDDQPHGLS